MPAVVATLVDEFPTLRLELSLAELRGSMHPGEPDVELYIAEAVRGDRDPAVADGDQPTGTTSRSCAPRAMWRSCRPGIRSQAAPRWRSPSSPTNRGSTTTTHAGPVARSCCRPAARWGSRRSSASQAPDYASAFDYVAQSVGITVLPRLGALALPAGVTVLPVEDSAARRRIMLRVKRSMRTHPARAAHRRTAARSRPRLIIPERRRRDDRRARSRRCPR